MAVGDQAGTIETVTNNASLTIRPSGTEEWVIHNIFAPTTANIEFYKHGSSLSVLADSNTGSFFNFFFHASNASYITIKNVSGASIEIGYDGTVTKA